MKVKVLIAVLSIALVAMFWCLFSSHILLQKEDGIYSGGSTWGDLAWHATLVSSFAERGLSSTINNNPIFLGTSLSYPFVPDLLSALFVKVGLSMRISMLWPAFLALILFLSIFYIFSLQIIKNKLLAFSTLLLFIFNGSLYGLGLFLKDWGISRLGLWDFLQEMTKDYTHLSEPPFGIHFTNILTTHILPQRAFVFGLLIGVIALFSLWKYWEKKEEKKYILYFAILTSILPLVHTHSFLTMCMIAFFLFLGEVMHVFYKKNWYLLCPIIKKWSLYFLLPILLIAFPQFLLVYPGDKGSFIRFGFGWMKGDNNVFVFWLKNLLPHIFIFIVAYYYAPIKIKTFYNSFFFVFMVSNIIVFQPHVYDNMKFMIWWYLLSVVITGLLFKKIIEKIKLRGIILVTILFLGMTLVGVLSVFRESYVSWRLFSNEDVALSDFILKNTSSDDIFLTASNHNNPVTCLAGRKILMGYTGWLWTHGIDYSKRESEINSIFLGRENASALIKKYSIDYIIYDNNKSKEENMSFLEKNYMLIYESSEKTYKVYKVNRVY